MWLRRAAFLPWHLLGVVGLLSVSAAVAPLKVLTSVLRQKPLARSKLGSRQRNRMPTEYYDVQDVSTMLSMVQAAMHDRSQQLRLQHSKVSQLGEQIEELRENLENTNYLFVQVGLSAAPC